MESTSRLSGKIQPTEFEDPEKSEREALRFGVHLRVFKIKQFPGTAHNPSSFGRFNANANGNIFAGENRLRNRNLFGSHRSYVFNCFKRKFPDRWSRRWSRLLHRFATRSFGLRIPALPGTRVIYYLFIYLLSLFLLIEITLTYFFSLMIWSEKSRINSSTF